LNSPLAIAERSRFLPKAPAAKLNDPT
jgi:hypothetical protein